MDAAVHASIAGQYDAVAAGISEGMLFRVEAGAAALGALLVLLRWHWIGDLFAGATALAGLVAIVLYRYVDVGGFGPVPDMYEPIWSPAKWWVVAGTAIALLALGWRPRGGYRSSRAS